jgi:hypothetical protein
MAKGVSKKPSVKKYIAQVRKSSSWTIVKEELRRPRGRPGKTESLFKAVGEKIPFEFLDTVKQVNTRGVGRPGATRGRPNV